MNPAKNLEEQHLPLNFKYSTYLLLAGVLWYFVHQCCRSLLDILSYFWRFQMLTLLPIDGFFFLFFFLFFSLFFPFFFPFFFLKRKQCRAVPLCRAAASRQTT
ncbi:hypothetical protein QBC35DRAFT_491241 [Podospora australis]|uniref:Uncharacterized protein n=1 Tax=Podospora australis TaxID=1536484 RepID=A0AAN7AK19_9PEZI|nr:hypothetical protein QBC35DRAFT_491241 [Podospora australis]